MSLSTRNADAAAALAAVRAEAAATSSRVPSEQRQAGKPPDLAASATDVEARACLGHSVGTSPSSSHRPSDAATVTALPHTAAAPRLSGSLVSTRHRPHVLQQPTHQPPQPIESFRRTARISYADLRAAADRSTRLIDFAQHPLAELTDRVIGAKAAQLGLPNSRGAVCWFVHTDRQVAEGRTLMISTSLSSPECMASFSIHFLTTRLELLLIAAATANQDNGACVHVCTSACVCIPLPPRAPSLVA